MLSFIKFYRIFSFGLGSIYSLGAFGLLSVYNEVPELNEQIFFNFYDAFYLTPFFLVVGLMMVTFTAITISLPYQLLTPEEVEEDDMFEEEEEEFKLPRGVDRISFFSSWVGLHAILAGTMILCMFYYSLRPETPQNFVWLLLFIIIFSIAQLLYTLLMYRIHNFLFPESGYY
jgi:hypothetical protein